jgi:hypothetical protein
MHKIFFSLFFGVSIATLTPIICYKQEKTARQEPTIYHTHAEQMVHSDGSDVNTDIDTVR